MHTTFMPALGLYERESLRRFVIEALSHEKFEAWYPLDSNCICLYVDSGAHIVRRGNWSQDEGYVYLAGSESSLFVPLSKRLGVLLALSQLCEAREALTSACTKAIGRYLLGEFNELRANQLVVSAGEETGIAFHPTLGSASCIDGEWLTPSGEPVDVSDSVWMVCAAPEVEAPVVEAVPVSATFAVGQRVHITHASGLGPDTAGDGVIIELPSTETRSNGRRYRVRMDDGRAWWVDPEAMTLLSATPPTFHVGQRVRYVALGTEESGEGVIESGPNHNGHYRVDSWWCAPEGITPLDAPTPTFTVSQRVRYLRIPHLTEEPGEGVVIDGHETETSTERMNIRMDNDDEVYVLRAECTAIDTAILETPAIDATAFPPTPRPFAVGDRVRWTPADGEEDTFSVGDGVIDSGRDDPNSWIVRLDVRQGRLRDVYVRSEHLTLLSAVEDDIAF
jgi:hypothetical protein